MDKMNKESEFGGNLSVQFDTSKRPLVVLGQDECIAKQYLFTQKTWHGSNGEQALIPKDEGFGLMISAFISHEFGFGMLDLMTGQLQRVNER